MDALKRSLQVPSFWSSLIIVPELGPSLPKVIEPPFEVANFAVVCSVPCVFVGALVLAISVKAATPLVATDVPLTLTPVIVPVLEVQPAALLI